MAHRYSLPKNPHINPSLSKTTITNDEYQIVSPTEPISRHSHSHSLTLPNTQFLHQSLSLLLNNHHCYNHPFTPLRSFSSQRPNNHTTTKAARRRTKPNPRIRRITIHQNIPRRCSSRTCQRLFRSRVSSPWSPSQLASDPQHRSCPWR